MFNTFFYNLPLAASSNPSLQADGARRGHRPEEPLPDQPEQGWPRDVRGHVHHRACPQGVEEDAATGHRGVPSRR